MPMNGVCDLELRQLIERAFLPDKCEVSCGGGMSLTLHFPSDEHRREMTVSDVHLATLPDCRALADLVMRVRQQREAQQPNRLGTLHRLTGR